jgi:hypothetical protein
MLPRPWGESVSATVLHPSVQSDRSGRAFVEHTAVITWPAEGLADLDVPAGCARAPAQLVTN